MSGRVLTYPIAERITKEVLDELAHYSSYRRFREIMGKDLEVGVVVYGLRDEEIEEIRKVDDNFKIIDSEQYLDELNNFIGDLYDSGKLEVKRRKKYYCENCNAYFDQEEVEFKNEKVVYDIIRVRIGRRLYFIDKLPSGSEPVGVSINDSDDLIYVKMDKETWISPASMRAILVRDIEVPEEEIKTAKLDKIKKKTKLTGYVITGNVKTGYITKENMDLYELPKVISSYSVIYSVENVTQVPTCPKCGRTLQEMIIPKLQVKFGEERIDISSELGSYKIPILYCDSCGHFEYGSRVKDCPVCGNVMEARFFYDSRIVTLGAYYHEIKETPEISFIHEKRGRYERLEKLLEAAGKKISSGKVILRHRFPEDDVPLAAYLLKKRGIVEVDPAKLRKMRNMLENLRVYSEIYGITEPRDKLDSWLVRRGEEVKREFNRRISSGNFAEAFNTLYNFVVKDFSRLYIGMKRKEPMVRRVLEDAARMYYVFEPEFSRELMGKMGIESIVVAMEDVPEVPGMEVVKEVVRKIMKFRNERDMPRREPIKKIVFVTDRAEEIKEFTERIMKFTNILVFNATDRWDEMELTIEPNLEAISRMYRAWAPKIAFLLKRKNVKDVMDALNKGGYTMGIEGFIIKITPDMVRYVEKVPKGYLKVKTKYGDMYVNSERDITNMRIRMVNEVIRRINYMRRDIEMEYDDLIDVCISTDDYITRILKGYVDEIKERTRARSVEFRYIEYAYVVEWPIMDFDVTIGINPLFKKWVIKAFQSIPGIAESKAELLFHMGYGSIYELMQASPTELADIPGFSLNTANRIREYLFENAFKPRVEKGKELCPFCGTELSEEDDFCPRCGAPIRVHMERKGVEEGNVYVAFGDFSKIVTIAASQFQDVKKLLITKDDPDEVKKEYNLKNVNIVWISYVPSPKSIKPKELEKLKDIIERNLGRGAKVIMWDAFDFMVAINGFDRMLDFLKEIREDVKSTNTILLFNVEEVEEEDDIHRLNEVVDGKL